MTKEHFWPKWLIKHTNMTKNKIHWIGGREVYPLTATIPLCSTCNSEIGGQLEAPMKTILKDIEAGNGISDNEAEIFIRWAWKMEGFSWRLFTPEGQYSERYTVKERCLQPLDHIRPRLVLALALLRDALEEKEYKPMGLCNANEINGIIVSGVISEVAFIVLTDDLIEHLPLQFKHYQLNPLRDKLGDAKLFYPEIGFGNFSESKWVIRMAANKMSSEMDRKLQNAT